MVKISWDKNTISCSEVDNTIELLKEMNVEYKLTILGEVEGNGLNDGMMWEENKKYPIRKLEYNDKVILEKLVRHPDCDVDDNIISEKFNKKEEPRNWEIEVTLVDEDELNPMSKEEMYG